VAAWLAEAPVLDAQQAFFQQQFEAIAVQLQLAEQTMRYAVRVLGDGLECFALAWRACQAWIVGACAFGQQPEALLPRFRRFALAQQHRQCPAEGVAEAVLVILGGPQAEPEQCGRQQRLAVEQFECRLELRFRYFAVVGQFDQHAHHLAPAEGHAQTHARLQRGGRAACRRQIIEQAAQRRGQGQAKDGRGHAAIPGGRAPMVNDRRARRCFGGDGSRLHHSDALVSFAP